MDNQPTIEYADWDEEAISDDDREEWDQKVLQIEALIRRLPLDQLNSVADYVVSLVKQLPNMGVPMSMLLSEEVLARSWDSPEDDAAWGSLAELLQSKIKNLKSKISGVLFDLDGTLVDTVDLIVAGFQHVTSTHLGYCIAPAAVKATIGRPLRECLSELAPGMGDTLYEAYQEFNRQYHDVMIREVPGIVPLLADLKRRGIAVGIVTSKRRVSAERSLGRFNLAAHFDILISQDDTTRHKPYPDPLHKGLERIGLPAANVIYVGDAIHDIMAAQAVPMRVAAVTWGAAERDTLARHAPDWLIDDVAQLREIIES